METSKIGLDMAINEMISLLLVNECLSDDYSIYNGNGGVLFFFLSISNSEFDEHEIVLNHVSKRVQNLFKTVHLHYTDDISSYYGFENGIAGKRFLLSSFYELNLIDEEYDRDFFRSLDEIILKYYDFSKYSELNNLRFALALVKSLKHEKDKVVFSIKKRKILGLFTTIIQTNLILEKISDLEGAAYLRVFRKEIEENIDVVSLAINFLNACYNANLFTSIIEDKKLGVIDAIISYLTNLNFSSFSRLSRNEVDRGIPLYVVAKLYSLIHAEKSFFGDRFKVIKEKIHMLVRSDIFNLEPARNLDYEDVLIMIKTVLNLFFVTNRLPVNSVLYQCIRTRIEFFFINRHMFCDLLLKPEAPRLGLSGVAGLGLIFLRYFFRVEDIGVLKIISTL